ncbi:hypothetical protein HYV86_01900 [Candidatus Woesearchaeota archaeon]|nr:hypothetical protein [Candidatus Woesearchaeota archaeon]
MVISKSTLLKHYKRPEIQQALVDHAQRKEIGIRYGEGFGKRPDTLQYQRDVLDVVMNGATSFHSSEELWTNPLAIDSKLNREELTALRCGWDLILDIDCAIFEYSRIAAELVIAFLEYTQVSTEDIFIKFSGNKGFHIGVPFEAFPQQINNVSTKKLFPEAARKIAAYVTHNIKKELARRIVLFEKGDFAKIKEKVNLNTEDIIYHEKNAQGQNIAHLNVDAFLEIDTILIASRHLYRMPYSLHEKSGLASIPIDIHSVAAFTRDMADPEKITAIRPFLRRDIYTDSARTLLIKAYDFVHKEDRDKTRESTKKQQEIQITSPIKEEFFPPCIQHISRGLIDGKKRGLFCLMNFLGKIGWNQDEVEKYIFEWNKRNPEPLREVYIKGQFMSYVAGEKLPPNCDNEGYYKALGCKCDTGICQRVKNPVNYTIFKWRKHLREQEFLKEKEQEKEIRKEARKREKEQETQDAAAEQQNKNELEE